MLREQAGGMNPPEQPDLFGEAGEAQRPGNAGAVGASARGGYRPLAERMRPRTLGEVVGQAHVVGPEGLLPRLLASDAFGSLLFYGPPGCGKTTLAHVVAESTGARFVRINAVLSNVAELREHLRWARSRPESRTVLFIDEIHRFNRAQQDLLLPDVEAGVVRLIGATTHNPGFYVIPPLLSRSHLFRLEPVPPADVRALLTRALEDVERGLGARNLTVDEGFFEGLARLCEGDVRRALNALETIALSQPLGACLGLEALRAFAKERQIRYDAGEDEHYDTASAFIKSIRGGDPDAALYWLVKMLEGGEDPRFIARRLVIFASEDIGLADPRALPLAVAAFQACEQVGLPECRLTLAHAVVFLATSPKSNSTTEALARATKHIREKGLEAVPLWLRDGHTAFNKSLGQGVGYLYSHAFPEAISGQEYMLNPATFYEPGSAGAEARIAERLQRWKALKAERKKAVEKDKKTPRTQ